jgi:hypothetical protein
VINLNLLMRNLHLGFDSLQDVWGVYSEDFWLRFAGRPKKRRKLSDLSP